jgi:predicted regulator of Ras-like GTPase activity (Roadblock/LC7/MglB family)
MSTDALLEELARYRRDPGIRAALFVSGDGFLIAGSADGSIDTEAVAAQIAGVLLCGRRLAAELDQEATRYLTFELDDLNILVAPFDQDMLLVLIGRPETLELTYTVRGGS